MREALETEKRKVRMSPQGQRRVAVAADWFHSSGLIKSVNILRIMESGFSLSKKEISERKKTAINHVVSGSNRKYQFVLMI